MFDLYFGLVLFVFSLILTFIKLWRNLGLSVCLAFCYVLLNFYNIWYSEVLETLFAPNKKVSLSTCHIVCEYMWQEITRESKCMHEIWLWFLIKAVGELVLFLDSKVRQCGPINRIANDLDFKMSEFNRWSDSYSNNDIVSTVAIGYKFLLFSIKFNLFLIKINCFWSIFD